MDQSEQHLRDLKKIMDNHARANEATVLKSLLSSCALTAAEQTHIHKQAVTIVQAFRENTKIDTIDQVFQYHGLDTPEGIALLNIAEALLRIPDKSTAIELIRDKLSNIQWTRKANETSRISSLIGRGISLSNKTLDNQKKGFFSKLLRSASSPLILKTVTKSMNLFNKKFVLAESVTDALKHPDTPKLASFDMLGESARTDTQANTYYTSYAQAIEALGQVAKPAPASPHANHGISVKLTALHPRFEWKKHEGVLEDLLPEVKKLCLLCARYNIPLTLDAEESKRSDLFFKILEALIVDPELKHWNGLGIALQAYRKQAYATIEWLIALTQHHQRHLAIRLVKGAYWDTEIKYDQELGLSDYSVFTRKVNTDISYLACAFTMLGHRKYIYSQFATHNAFTIAAIMEKATPDAGFEFQRLYGMGGELYTQALNNTAIPCRVYAPIGNYKDLLPYLVRRFLENGANSSFVNQLSDQGTPAEKLIENPMETLTSYASVRNNQIPLADDLYKDRKAAVLGMDLDFETQAAEILANIGPKAHPPYTAKGTNAKSEAIPVRNPANHDEIVGTWTQTTADDINVLFEKAQKSQPQWDAVGGSARASCLRKAADLMEAEPYPFMDLIIREAGRTIADAIAEIREAVDFCRYYAKQAEQHFGKHQSLPGPTGEINQLSLHGKGVFVCISPWNFPLAIFMGQVTAALAAGNAVIAKPAKQTPLIAARAIKLLYDAGIPQDLIGLVLGPGSQLGDLLTSHPKTAGVVFTGSTQTAQHVNRLLAEKPGAITPLIAETGGQNAMIIDTTALPEQTIDHIIESSFMSAGQRCSSLRVLFLPEETADTVTDMLLGAVDKLKLGDPTKLDTDIGPVIDESALKTLQDHVLYMQDKGTLLNTPKAPQNSPIDTQNDPKKTLKNTYFAPHIYTIDHIEKLRDEVFGPVLHIIRYKSNQLDNVLQQISQTGYGLTLGVQTRILSKAHDIFEKLSVGNTYVNRNMVGAVVGSQPFGGHGLSGTGPKAGGPHYLFRFANEKVLTINTTATGGNPELLNIKEE